MNCDNCRELLSAFIDDNLSPQENKSVEAHIAECTNCARELQELLNTVSLLTKLPKIEAPEGFHQQFKKRWDKENTRFYFWPGKTAWFAGIATAAAGMLVTLIFYNPLTYFNFPNIDNSKKNTLLSDGKQHTYIETPKLTDLVEMKKQNILSNYAERNISNNFDTSLIKPVSMNYGSYTLPRTNPMASNYMVDLANNLGEKLYREKQIWSGDHCEFNNYMTRILYTREDLKKLWQEGKITSVPLPNIDWRKHRAAAIFLGEKYGHGYEIKVKEIKKASQNIELKYEVIPPSKINNTTTQPFLIVIIPKNNLPVVFSEETKK